MSYTFFYKSSFHISVLVVSGGTRRFTDLKSVEVLSEGRPLCRLPRLDRTRVQHSQAGLPYISTYLSNYLTIYSQAGLLVCGNWDSRAEETCSSLSDGVWTRSLVLIQDRFAHMTSHDLT